MNNSGVKGEKDVKRHRFKILAVVLMFGLIAAWMFWPAQTQPSYQGQPLGKWLEALGLNSGDTNALAAISDLGTNAVPGMAEAINQAPGAFRRNTFDFVVETAIKLHLRSGPWWEAKRLRATGALHAFKFLGSNASNAIPALAKTINWNEYAAEALGYAGPGALPTLTNALATCSKDQRLDILFAIGNGGTNAAAAVPLIVTLLHDMSYSQRYPVREIAADVLGYIRSQPAIALPALTNLFGDTNSAVRLYAVKAVAEFCAEAKPVASALTNMLNDPDANVRSSATNALESIEQNQPVRGPMR